ncbi:uroporphyrinogen-III synthase [Bacillus sp. CLL-7-23]|uniref:Uroporphyrinogen-III synthase n=1 Tax=Bacillus changyiensis TaxID=3004103 RepID=A0ABT4X5M0_9BACI|nr:uroporphyrinogen-III synthase [Bacillus changyiensis]MDA7027590.1 uroporphyrinogen-III synthase [Bacillus changyiensis]
MNDHLPLQGKQVLVTRHKAQARSFGKKIEALGGRPILTSLISFRPAMSSKEASFFQADLEQTDWLVFTSVNGAKFFFSYLEGHGISFSAQHRTKVAAVGEKTARYIRDRHLAVDLVPDLYVAEQLAEALKEKVGQNDKVMVVKGNLGRNVIKDTLAPLGIDISESILYQTVPDSDGILKLRETAKFESFDFVTFTSSSTVHTFMDIMKEDSKKWLEHQTAFISIGPLTKQALDQYGIPSFMPNVYTIDGMLDKMCSISKKGE